MEAQLGVPVGLSVDGATRAAFTLTVTDIARAQECPSRIAEPAVVTAENGTFLVVDLNAQMAADYAAYDPDAPFLTLDRDAFHLTDRDGNIQEDSHSVASYACYPAAERVTPLSIREKARPARWSWKPPWSTAIWSTTPGVFRVRGGAGLSKRRS